MRHPDRVNPKTGAKAIGHPGYGVGFERAGAHPPGFAGALGKLLRRRDGTKPTVGQVSTTAKASRAAPLSKRVGPRCDVHRFVWLLIGHLIGHFIES